VTVKRMDNVGIVVEDIDAAIEFFTELGLELEGRAPVEGDWADGVTGLRGVRVTESPVASCCRHTNPGTMATLKLAAQKTAHPSRGRAHEHPGNLRQARHFVTVAPNSPDQSTSTKIIEGSRATRPFPIDQFTQVPLKRRFRMSWLGKSISSELKDCTSQAQQIGLPDFDCRLASEYRSQGEYALALDHLCTQLYEHDIHISLDFFNKLMAIRTRLGPGIKDWSILRELVIKSDGKESNKISNQQ